MNANRFLIGASVVVALMAFAFPATNLLVDPYQVFSGPTIPGINVQKPAASTRARLSKSLTVCRLQPDLVILGSSRSEFIFEPEHPALSRHSNRPYNYAMAGSGIKEMAFGVRHAYFSAGIKTAIVAIDFHMFNAYREDIVFKNIVVDFDKNNLILSKDDNCFKIFFRVAGPMIFSGHTLKASLNTIRRQNTQIQNFYLPTGRRDTDFMDKYVLQSDNAQASGFRGQVQAYLDHVWFPKPSQRYCFASNSSSTINEFRNLVAFGREKGIKFYFVLTPDHSFLQLAIRFAGLWPLYERWRSDLVKVLAEDQTAHPDMTPYALWDFSTLNPITAEPRPPVNVPAKVKSMKWWYEATHSQKNVGQLILDKVLETSPAPDRFPNFGIRLNSSNIRTHLEKLRINIERYGVNNPDEISEIEELSGTYPGRPPISQYCTESALTKRSFDKPVEQEVDLVAAARYQKKGDRLRKTGLFTEALQAYDDAIRVSIPNTALHYLRGTLKMELHDWAGAEQDFQIGLTLDPENLTLRQLLKKSRAKTRY